MNVNLELYGVDDTELGFYAKGNEKNIGKRWNLKAKDWDHQLNDISNHLNQDDAYRSFIVVAQNLIDEKLHYFDDISLLDVGCGTGCLSEELSPNFSHVTGIDISDAMLAEAKKKLVARSEFYNKSVFSLDEKWKKFDLIVSRGVLISHYGNNYVEDILLSLRRVIKNGGYLIIDFLNSEVTGMSYKHLPKNKTYFSSDYIIETASILGFRDVEIVGNKNSRTLISIMRA